MTRLLTLGFVLLTLAAGHLKADDAAGMPIKVTVRESLLVKGTFVAQFRNQGDSNLVLHIEFDRSNASARKTFSMIVPANGMKEIGNNQGWIVVSGDQITIACDGYPNLQVQAP